VVQAETARALLEWKLRERFGAPADRDADAGAAIRAAVDRAVPDAAPALRPPAADSARDVARWATAVRALKDAAASSASVARLAEDCGVVLSRALERVVDPNLGVLEEHLGAIGTDQLHAAAEALRADPRADGLTVEASVHAKAAAVHHVMAVALDDVQQQFIGGVSDVCLAELEALLPHAPTAAALVAGAVEARRRAIEKPWRTEALVKRILDEVRPGSGDADADTADEEEDPSHADTPRPVGHATVAEAVRAAYAPESLLDRPRAPAAALAKKLAEDPAAWLFHAVVSLDDVEDLFPAEPAGVGAFLQAAIARYLDPHIDGDAQPPSQAQLRALAKEGGFPERARRAWESRAPRPSGPFPPTDLLVAAYVRHCVRKMDATLCFGPHVPGVGREPVSAMQQQRHLKILAVAIVEAVQRDFNEGHAVLVRGVPLTTDLVERIVQAHMKGLYADHEDLKAALHAANMEGEEARKAERMRIWGYA